MGATSNRDKLMAAFALGDIWAIGGAVYDAKHRYLFLTTDLAELRHEVPFSRIDSGGSPTWRLSDSGSHVEQFDAIP